MQGVGMRKGTQNFHAFSKLALLVVFWNEINANLIK